MLLIRKKNIIVIVTIIIASGILPYTNHKITNASNNEYEDLIGEWSAVWPGNRGDRSTIIVHEINEMNSTARITYIADLADEGRKLYEINADFFPDPPPTIKFNVRGNDFTCYYKKRRNKLDVSFVGTIESVGATRTNSCEMRKHVQIFSQVDDLLARNPLSEGQKAQAIKIVDNNNVTISLVRSIEGAGLKPHFHRTHNEMLYAVQGQGKLLLNDEWFDFKPGDVHFNPVGKVHTTKQIGTEPLVFLSIFIPGMEYPDRQFVE